MKVPSIPLPKFLGDFSTVAVFSRLHLTQASLLKSHLLREPFFSYHPN